MPLCYTGASQKAKENRCAGICIGLSPCGCWRGKPDLFQKRLPVRDMLICVACGNGPVFIQWR